MATKHGNRIYIQVLLEPYRGELFMEEAAALGVKPSALIRDLVYDYLASMTDEDSYVDATLNDKQKWQDAVDARLEGRARNRRLKAIQSNSNQDIIDDSTD